MLSGRAPVFLPQVKATGWIRVRQQVETRLPAAVLFEAFADPRAYVAEEPRILSARWIEDGPGLGARGEVVADIPFTVPLVRRLFGRCRGTLLLTSWAPPQRCAGSFSGGSFDGGGSVEVRDLGNARVVDVDVAFTPASKVVTLVLTPVRERLERLAANSISRGFARFERASLERINC